MLTTILLVCITLLQAVALTVDQWVRLMTILWGLFVIALGLIAFAIGAFTLFYLYHNYNEVFMVIWYCFLFVAGTAMIIHMLEVHGQETDPNK